jgi:hypothetical protein
MNAIGPSLVEHSLPVSIVDRYASISRNFVITWFPGAFRHIGTLVYCCPGAIHQLRHVEWLVRTIIYDEDVFIRSVGVWL